MLKKVGIKERQSLSTMDATYNFYACLKRWGSKAHSNSGATHSANIICLTSEGEVPKCYDSLVSPLQSRKSRNVQKVIKVATTKNGQFLRKAIMQIDIFAASKDEWNTKEDIDKSMKNELYMLWYAKRHL